MAITSAIVLYAVCWFLTLLVVLPFRLRTQEDEGVVVPGTQSGAPANFRPRRTLTIATVIAAVVWAILYGIIVYGGLTIRDLDFFQRMGPPAG